MTSSGQDCCCDQRFGCFCESGRKVIEGGGRRDTVVVFVLSGIE